MTIKTVIPEDVYKRAKTSAIQKRVEKESALKAPDDPVSWMQAMFPSIFNRPFGQMHVDVFNWAWNIKLNEPYNPLVAVWSRGFGKSTVCEASTIMVGARGLRKYCLYVSATQELADQHVASIRDMAESAIMRSYYPQFAKPKLSKEGHSRGWRRNRLVFGNGFTVDSVGLDTAKRGSKMMDQRPSYFILDDIDEKGDGPNITQKKIDTVFTSLLPAGSKDATVLAVQNMIIDTGIFAKLASSDPPFMKDRILSGPFPALENFEWWYDEEGKIDISGKPTWSGFTLPEIKNTINTVGITAFQSEYQHVIVDEGSLFAGIKFNRINRRAVPKLISTVVSIDPAVTSKEGSDSHGICCMGMDERGKKYILDWWEKRATPEFSLRKALYFAVKNNANLVRIESNQGGETFLYIWDRIVEESGLDEDRVPGVELVRASASTGSKMERASQMLIDYELNKMYHVDDEFTEDLEKALLRFPTRPPDDGVDACYWSWNFLNESERWFL